MGKIFIISLMVLLVLPTVGYAANIPLISNPVSNHPTDEYVLALAFNSGLYRFTRPLMENLTDRYMFKLRDWTEKPFPVPTYMFFGGMGKKPAPFLVIITSPNFSIPPYNPPDIITLYVDGQLYDSKTPIPFPSQDPFFYICSFLLYEQGFHHLEFVPDNNESNTVMADSQLGFNGFFQNIFPYLVQRESTFC